jgi:hypothetical protein
MSVNKHQPHILVLPEDRANLQMADGFHGEVPWHRQRQMQVLRVAGGWNEVLNSFESVHAMEMERCLCRFMVLLIDFDGKQERLTEAKAKIPARLAERVFILGALTKPEDLRQAGLGSYEEIGLAMAKDCREGSGTVWGHDLLRHNAGEIERLRQHVRPILFPSL